MVGTCRRSILEFARCSEKKVQAEVGVAYMRRCNDSCMYGYKGYECATKYAGVMSVTKNAQKWSSKCAT